MLKGFKIAIIILTALFSLIFITGICYLVTHPISTAFIDLTPLATKISGVLTLICVILLLTTKKIEKRK